MCLDSQASTSRKQQKTENNPAARKCAAFKSKDDYFVPQGGTKSLERRTKSYRETFLDLEN